VKAENSQHSAKQSHNPEEAAAAAAKESKQESQLHSSLPVKQTASIHLSRKHRAPATSNQSVHPKATT